MDLIRHYKLLGYYEFFCKRTLPLAISDTPYFHNVVGDTEIRKGEGMELNQLLHYTYTRETNAHIKPFDLDTLRQAFQLRETAFIDLPSVSSLLSWLLLISYCFLWLDCPSKNNMAGRKGDPDHWWEIKRQVQR